MGGEGADDSTLAMLETMLARRRGTAPGSRARTADELAALLDRASDLSLAEFASASRPSTKACAAIRCTNCWSADARLGIDVSRMAGETHQRIILTETYGRYAAAFGDDAVANVGAGVDLEPRPAADVVPDALRRSALTTLAARRDLLARFVSLGGAVSIDDVLARYDFERAWIEERLDDWTRSGKLVRGTFGGDAATTRWCSRRLLEQARRRELAHARKQIEAVDLATVLAVRSAMAACRSAHAARR